MNRNYIHDIKPSSRTQKRREALHRVHERHMHELEESFEPRYQESRGGGSRGVWYIAALAIIILVFALTFLFAGATVFVTPRTGTVELSGPIAAEKESRAGLSFEMLVLDDEVSTSVAAGEKEYVERRATGRVRFYNNHSEAAQKLLIDTRLESPDGHIYKTKTAVTIPGQKTENGKKVPGTVEVDIYADEAGDVYNIEQADFKIVGFRGSPKYETFYARSTTPIKGGFRGDTYNVGDEKLASESETLKAKLSSSLIEKARAELPEDFIMYDKVSVVSFEDPVIEESTPGTVEIKQRGKLSAIIFKEVDLTSALVEKVITNTEENKVTIPNIRDLAIELDKGSVVSDPEKITDVKIVINDKVEVVWEVNEEELKDALVGIKKRDFENKMLQFKNIDKAELNLKPFWKNTLPNKTGAIKVVNTLTVEE